MSLVDELLAEKRKSVLETLKKDTVKLKEIKNVTVIIDKLDNTTMKDIITKNGVITRAANPTATVFMGNARNKTISKIILQSGNVEV